MLSNVGPLCLVLEGEGGHCCCDWYVQLYTSHSQLPHNLTPTVVQYSAREGWADIELPTSYYTISPSIVIRDLQLCNKLNS